MIDRRHELFISTIASVILFRAVACGVDWSTYHASPALKAPSNYTWTKVTDKAGFPGGYNFPLFNIKNTLWVLRSEGNWFSGDGKNWAKSELPPSG